MRTGGFRDELFLKLFGASSLGPQALTALVTAQRQAYLSELAGLTRLRRSHVGDPLVGLLIDAAIAHTKADLELVDSAAARLAPLAERNAGAAAREDAGEPQEQEQEQGQGQGQEQEREQGQGQGREHGRTG